MNAQEFPANMVIYCLAYDGCPGDVAVHYLENSHRMTEGLQPTRGFDIFEGMRVHEYVIPFQNLHDSFGRRGSTAGFNIIARSSFRVAAASYGTRTLDMTMIFPLNGGGIIRIAMGAQEWDIANPTFDPRAPVPAVNMNYGAGRGNEYMSGPAGIDNMRVPEEILVNAYQRTHRGYVGGSASEVERRRQERLANFDFQEVPSDAVEASRLARIAQANASANQDSPSPETPSIVLPVPKVSKAPPRSRLERIADDEK